MRVLNNRFVIHFMLVCEALTLLHRHYCMLLLSTAHDMNVLPTSLPRHPSPDRQHVFLGCTQIDNGRWAWRLCKKISLTAAANGLKRAHYRPPSQRRVRPRAQRLPSRYSPRWTWRNFARCESRWNGRAGYVGTTSGLMFEQCMLLDCVFRLGFRDTERVLLFVCGRSRATSNSSTV